MEQIRMCEANNIFTSVLDTENVCFVCLREIFDDKSNHRESCNFSDRGTETPAVIIRNICRYLKMDTAENLLRNVNKGQANKQYLLKFQKKKWNFSVMLCSECSLQTRKLADLIAQLEKVQMLVNYQLQEFSHVLNRLDETTANSKWNEFKTKLDAEGSNSEEIRLVEDLRHLTKRKVQRIKITISPRVLLEPLSNSVIAKVPPVDKGLELLHNTDVNSPCPSSCNDISSNSAVEMVHDKAISGSPDEPKLVKESQIPKVQRCHKTANDRECGRILGKNFGGKPRKCKTLQNPKQKYERRFLCAPHEGGCGKMFIDSSSLSFRRRHHCVYGDAKTSWKCDKLEGGCGKVLSSKRSYFRHKQNNCSARDKKYIECSLEDGGCGKRLSSRIAFKRHQLSRCGENNTEDIWKCDLGDGQCGKKSITEAGLLRHKKFNCPYRDNPTTASEVLAGPAVPIVKDILFEPLETPSEEPEVKTGFAEGCPVDNFELMGTNMSKDAEIKPEVGSEDSLCPTIEDSTANSAVEVVHDNTITGYPNEILEIPKAGGSQKTSPTIWLCDPSDGGCGMTLACKSNLNKHRKNTCPGPGGIKREYSVVQKKKIPKDLRSQKTTPRIWLCDPKDEGCGMICSTKDSLRRHRENHCKGPGETPPKNRALRNPGPKPERRFLCARSKGGCGKMFTSRFNLNFHRRHHCAHLGDAKPSWKCDKLEGGCGKVLSSKRSYLGHKKSYCPNREKMYFECSLEDGGCGKRFSNQKGLQRHQYLNCKMTAGEDVWKCDQGDGKCGKKFITERGLLCHKKFTCPYRNDAPKGSGDLAGPSIPTVKGILHGPLEVRSQAPEKRTGLSKNFSFENGQSVGTNIPREPEVGSDDDVGFTPPIEPCADEINIVDNLMECSVEQKIIVRNDL